MKPKKALIAGALLIAAVAAAVLFSVLSPQKASRSGIVGEGAELPEPVTSALATLSESRRENVAMLARLDVAEQSIAALQRALRAEQNSTLALQNELQDLRSQVEDTLISGDIGVSDLAANPGHDLFSNSQSEGGVERGNRARPAVSAEAAMIAAGIDTETARDLRARIDRYTLAELEVRDTAAREGWLESDDYRQRRDALLPAPVDIRQELGEQAWDSYLLAVGSNNRVKVESVIEDSAAFNAGVEVGDFLLEYAGEAIFSIRELQQATRAGERGELVSVRLGRGTDVIDTTLARGPLGVTLTGVQLQPAE